MTSALQHSAGSFTRITSPGRRPSPKDGESWVVFESVSARMQHDARGTRSPTIGRMRPGSPPSSSREAGPSWSLCLRPLVGAGPRRGGALTASWRRGFLLPRNCPLPQRLLNESQGRSLRGTWGEGVGSWRGLTPLSRQALPPGKPLHPTCLGLLSGAQLRISTRDSAAGPGLAPPANTRQKNRGSELGDLALTLGSTAAWHFSPLL